MDLHFLIPQHSSSSIEQTRRLAATARPPTQGEDVRFRFERRQLHEQKEAVTAFQSPASVQEVLDTFGAGRDGQDAEAWPAEPGAVNVLRPRRFVCEEFAVKAARGQADPCHRHGGSVGFKEEPCAIPLSALVQRLQTKDAIWDDAAFQTPANVHRPLKRLSLPPDNARQLALIRTKQPNASLLAARGIYRAAGYTLVNSEPHHSFGQALVGETWELVLS